MSIVKDPELVKQLKAGIANPVEIERWLLNNCSAPALAHELAEYLIKAEASRPIVISSPEAFFAHFKIAGYRFVNGTLEPDGRGRKK